MRRHGALVSELLDTSGEVVRPERNGKRMCSMCGGSQWEGRTMVVRVDGQRLPVARRTFVGTGHDFVPSRKPYNILKDVSSFPLLRYLSPLPSRSMSPAESVDYSASCNPPRHAKRARTTKSPSHPLVTNTPSSRPILPRRNSPAAGSLAEIDENDEEDIDDSDYEEALSVPGATAPVAKPRGRKPGSLSRSTRESLRKQNHSRIEKARRTKINDALDTLRTLVPDEYRSKVKEEGMAEDYGSNEKKTGKKGDKDQQPKEFKLEVLVRTVAYMKDLISMVQELEARTGVNASEDKPSSGLKRKRTESTDEHGGQEVGTSSPLNGQQVRKAEDLPASPPSPSKSPFLPSISSWLPQTFVDPSFFSPSSHSTQLPSPPLSAKFRPRSDSASRSSSTGFPLLSLPSPKATHAPPVVSGDGTRQKIVHTPEDESAASLLLHIKSFPMSKSNVQTPGSVLGLEAGRA